MARDFEITKRCAEAMGLKVKVDGGHVWTANSWNSKSFSGYAPLLNDEQAMALVKRFTLDVTWDDGEWDVSPPPGPVRPLTTHVDLNRAIVECVAKIQVSNKDK